MSVQILQCPRCRAIREWDRVEHPEGPGHCHCGAWAPWRVLKARPPQPGPGHVIVITDKGWQPLHGPGYREDPDAWRKGPVPV